MIIKEYMEYQNNHIKKFGKNTLVLMEVGSFFEYYAVNNSETNEIWNYDLMLKVTEILDATFSEKKTKYPHYMGGFPNFSLHKHLNKLLNEGFTVIIIEQDSHGESKPDRKITNIFSPGINIEYNKSYENNYLCCINFEFYKLFNSNKHGLSIGIAFTDLSTGNTRLYETGSDKDYNNPINEIYRILKMNEPSQILIYNNNYELLSENEITDKLEIHNITKYFKDFDKKYKKKNLQIEILNRSYQNLNKLNIFEYLNISKYDNLIYSFVVLLDYAIEHNSDIVKKLNKPEILENDNHLILTNNSINQLDITPDKNRRKINKFNSLQGIINNCSTSFGKRLLNNRLLNPLTNVNKLNERYNLIELFRNKDIENLCDEIKVEGNLKYNYKYFEKLLTSILDLERLHRRINLGILTVNEFPNLDNSYKKVLKIFNLLQKYLKNQNNKKEYDFIPSANTISLFHDFRKEYNNKLNLEIFKKLGRDITQNIFNKGYNTKIDKIQSEIDYIESYFKALAKKFSTFIKDNKNNNGDLIKIIKKDKEQYLELTSRRGKLLKEALKGKDCIKLNLNSDEIVIKRKDIEYKNKNSKTRIYTYDLKNYENKLLCNYERLNKLCKDCFKELLKEFSQKYYLIFNSISKFIAEIDVIKSSAKTSIIYNYCKPTIKNSEKSFINSKNIRHPIIERIQTEFEYIPNDCNIGNNINGMLLYGVNASGKSSYMKSIGLNLIMAQAGFYVAAETFEYYPYTKIFTRICGNDNIFKGHSSFAVEMLELRNILNSCDDRSLILGDELCRGTESNSAIAIVGSGICSLDKKNSQFIFATHLHGLNEFDEIKEMKKLKTYHLSVKCENGVLIYDRKLKEGSGDSLYGLEVCKSMDMDADFIKKAYYFRNKLTKNDDYKTKESKYNKNIIMDKCAFCKINKAVETHHIKYQKDADNDNFIEHIHKNNESNLVPLCKKCHDMETYGPLNILGWIDTSEGKKLDYTINKNKEKVRKKKFNDIQIEIIKDFIDNNPNVSQKIVCELLREEKNLNVSTNILSKIKKGCY